MLLINENDTFLTLITDQLSMFYLSWPGRVLYL